MELRKAALSDVLKDYPSALKLQEVAEILNICERKVDDLIRKGIIISFVVDPDSQKKQIRVNKSDLMDHMLNGGK